MSGFLSCFGGFISCVCCNGLDFVGGRWFWDIEGLGLWGCEGFGADRLGFWEVLFVIFVVAPRTSEDVEGVRGASLCDQKYAPDSTSFGGRRGGTKQLARP